MNKNFPQKKKTKQHQTRNHPNFLKRLCASKLNLIEMGFHCSRILSFCHTCSVEEHWGLVSYSWSQYCPFLPSSSWASLPHSLLHHLHHLTGPQSLAPLAARSIPGIIRNKTYIFKTHNHFQIIQEIAIMRWFFFKYLSMPFLRISSKNKRSHYDSIE